MSGAKQPEWTWWEKTVEYLFVRQAKFLKIAPLDGNHEKAGDAILRNKNGKYYLVEFKNLEKPQPRLMIMANQSC